MRARVGVFDNVVDAVAARYVLMIAGAMDSDQRFWSRGADRRRDGGRQEAQPRSASGALPSLLGPRQRPAWFDSSI